MNTSMLNQSEESFFRDSALNAFSKMEARAARRGLLFPQVRPQSLKNFNELPAEKQKKFANYLSVFERAFEFQMDQADEFLDVSVEAEGHCLKTVENLFKICIGKDVPTSISKGDIVEIYDLEAIQVYRNLNFFRTTNYNLMDIAAHTWMELWDRSSMVQEKIVAGVGRALNAKDDKPIPFDVPVHLLKERAFGMTQALAIHLKYISQVRTEAGDLFGFLTIMEAHPVAEGPEADKIGFV